MHIGLRWPSDAPGIVAKGRIIHVIVDLRLPLHVFSCYFKSGAGLCAFNLSLLRQLGERLTGKHLYVVGGDWNLDPHL
eukprot:3466234-Pyramimonas_sp.AAC.1